MMLTGEQWLLLLGGILFFVWGISIFCFSRITIKYIENEMAKEKKLPPEWDKGIGARYSAYAVAILINRVPPMSIVDTKSIKRHARKKDWYLAIFFMGSLTACMVVVALVAYLYGGE